MTRTLCCGLVLLLIAAPVIAQPAAPAGIFEAIPKEASAALVLRSIHDFRTKGRKLLDDIELQVELTPDKLVMLAYQLLRLEGGVDEKAPVVLATLNNKRAGVTPIGDIVLLVPIADRDKILAGLKLPKKPKDNEIVELRDGGFLAPTALVVRRKYLCLGLSSEPLKRLTDDSLAVSDAEKQQFGDADILVYLGREAWPFVWGGYLDQLDRYFSRRRADEEKKVGQQFVKGLNATQHSFLSLRFHEGLRLRSNMVFDIKKERAARDMLEILKAGTSRSAIKELTDGRAIAALGWAGDGSKNGILTKLVFDVFLEGPLPGKLNDLPVFATTDYPAVVGITHELWQRLQGARVGLYHNLNEKELGLFSAVAVLDTADADAFLKEVRALAKIANLTAADLKLAETKNLIDIEKLVRDLGSSNFRTRESAATRLLLLGEPALPEIQKILTKPMSLEQKRRAELLKRDIDQSGEQRRKELLMPKEMPRSLKASFAVAPSVEKRAGVSVDVLKMSFNTKNPRFLKQVEQLLGPNWDKLRLAVVGNQVVVLLGSDAALLDQTIANVKAGKGGLQETKLLAGFEKRADKNRTAEMHGSAQAFLGFVATDWKLPPRFFREAPELTSFAISFETDRLQIDLWVPTRELRTMVHAVFPSK
jgi:hypothetical protein